MIGIKFSSGKIYSSEDMFHGFDVRDFIKKTDNEHPLLAVPRDYITESPVMPLVKVKKKIEDDMAITFEFYRNKYNLP